MIDLSDQHLQIVTQILKQHLPDCTVLAFGSRVQNNAKKYSDLDLAIVGSERLDRRRIYRLKEAFEDSVLPFRVDIVDWFSLTVSFRGIITKCCEVIHRPTD